MKELTLYSLGKDPLVPIPSKFPFLEILTKICQLSPVSKSPFLEI
jgi:hypothetical protein